MPVVYANLGSNIGDREELINKALRLIEKEFGTIKKSNMVESDPWGFDSTFLFLNIGISFISDENPFEILRKLQSIEKSISDSPHRDDKGNYQDREIDIDIIAIDDMVMDTPELILPHPRMRCRKFVIKPMAELAPSWRHPISGERINEMLDKIEKSQISE